MQFSPNFLNWPRGTDQLYRVLSQVSIWILWMPNVHVLITRLSCLVGQNPMVCVCGWKWSQSWRVDLLMKRGEPFWVNNPLNVSVNAIEFEMGWFNYSGHFPTLLFGRDKFDLGHGEARVLVSPTHSHNFSSYFLYLLSLTSICTSLEWRDFTVTLDIMPYSHVHTHKYINV